MAEEQQLYIWIEDAGDGDTEAFRELFEHLEDRVFRYALSHTSSREDALDITQDVFVDLWKALKSFYYQSDEEFYGFVFVIVKRRVAKVHRSRKSTISIDEISEPRVEEKKTDDAGVRKFVDKLDKNLRDVIVHRYWHGLKLKEVAEKLHISETAAKVRHHRGLKKLKEIISKYDKAT